MKMEDLTKTQVILLTLLTSFVTSIATGIVTVTLMDQAPPQVVRTLNRVIERTVETVVPSTLPTSKKQEATVVTKETTVVVKEEDLITDTLKKNGEVLVRIYEEQGVLSETGSLEIKSHFAGLGVLVSQSGLVATDSSFITSGALYKGFLKHRESSISMKLALYDPKEKIALLQLETPVKEADPKVLTPVATTFPSATFADITSLKIGQTVLSLGGETRDQADIGILSSIQEKDADLGTRSKAEAKKTIVSLGTSIRNGDATGAPLFNIFGELIAISVIGATNNPAYVPVSSIVNQIAIVQEKGAGIKTTSATTIP